MRVWIVRPKIEGEITACVNGETGQYFIFDSHDSAKTYMEKYNEGVKWRTLRKEFRIVRKEIEL